MRTATIVVVLCTSMLLTGCGVGYEQAVVPKAVPAFVDVNTDAIGVLTSLGDTRTLTATVHAGDGRVISRPTLTWTSSAPDVATVSETDGEAIVTATGNGTALITVTADTAHYTVGITVRQAIASVVLLHAVSILEPGSKTQFTAVALDARYHGIPLITNFTFSSPDSSVVSVTPNGEVFARLSPGADSTATIFAEVTRQGVTFTGNTRVRVDRADAASLRNPPFTLGLRP